MRKDGTRFWAHGVIDAMRDDDGALVGFAKITRDITERKQAAEQLEKTCEALFQSQKLEALGKLTGGVAHDFNNLLNVLTNGLSMLRQATRDPEALRLVDSMEMATGRAAARTQQLLSFARQQAREPGSASARSSGWSSSPAATCASCRPRGQGTSVSMFFPALPPEQQPAQDDQDGSEKVLVVDDQPEVLAMVADIFRNLGFDVLTAGDGRSALNLLTREANVGILFSDIVMPGINGIALARQVKERFPSMKIVLASGYPPPEAGDLKDFDFLPKPFSMADVARKLRVLAR